MAARHLVEVKGFQERRVCRLLNFARSNLRYQPKQDEPEEQNLTEHLKTFATLYSGIIGLIVGFFFGRRTDSKDA